MKQRLSNVKTFLLGSTSVRHRDFSTVYLPYLFGRDSETEKIRRGEGGGRLEERRCNTIAYRNLLARQQGNAIDAENDVSVCIECYDAARDRVSACLVYCANHSNRLPTKKIENGVSRCDVGQPRHSRNVPRNLVLSVCVGDRQPPRTMTTILDTRHSKRRRPRRRPRQRPRQRQRQRPRQKKPSQKPFLF